MKALNKLNREKLVKIGRSLESLAVLRKVSRDAAQNHVLPGYNNCTTPPVFKNSPLFTGGYVSRHPYLGPGAVAYTMSLTAEGWELFDSLTKDEPWLDGWARRRAHGGNRT